MPTPFYHLRLANDLLELPSCRDEVRKFLLTWQYEFMLGSIAPDVQVISGQPREDTHFFNLTLYTDDQPAWWVMLNRYPDLSQTGLLTPAHMAFLAGYLCHLQADWYWVKDIFLPFFGPNCAWGSFSDRLHYHNVLRAYLDLQIQPELALDLGTDLARVSPANWLPFTPDQHLEIWRDFVSQQLHPGAAIQSVEVFSSRQGTDPYEYYTILRSPERMQQEIFSRISFERVQAYYQRTVSRNLQLLTGYLASSLHPTIAYAQGSMFTGVQP
jgi:hypothetical protein